MLWLIPGTQFATFPDLGDRDILAECVVACKPRRIREVPYVRTSGNYANAGTLGESLLERYSIHACIHELNANWIAGLDAYPKGKERELYGAQLCEVFDELFSDD